MAHLGPPVCKIGPDSGHRLRRMLKTLFPFTVVTTPGGWAKHTERRPSRLPMLDSETLGVGPELDGWGQLHTLTFGKSPPANREAAVSLHRGPTRLSGPTKVGPAGRGRTNSWASHQVPGPGAFPLRPFF